MKILDFANQLDLKRINWIMGSDYKGSELDYIFYRGNHSTTIVPIESQINFSLINFSDHPPIGVTFQILQLNE